MKQLVPRRASFMADVAVGDSTVTGCRPMWDQTCIDGAVYGILQHGIGGSGLEASIWAARTYNILKNEE